MNVSEPLPFYKVYPLEPFLTEHKLMEAEKEKMLSFLPKECRILQKQVEKVCDELEYEGSRMYDDYPDHHVINKMIQRLVPKISDEREQKYWQDIAGCYLCNEMLYRRYRKRSEKKYIK